MTQTHGAQDGGDHRRLLQDAAADFCARESDLKRVRGWRGRTPGFDRALWQKMAGLGWFGILVPERYGGSGLGITDMALVARELGTALLPEPVVPAVVLAGRIILHADNEVLKRNLLTRQISGELIPALAWQEGDGGLDVPCTTTASRAGGGFVLCGAKRFVYPAAGADGFVVSARGPDGVALYWVQKEAAGLGLAYEPRADGTLSGRLTLANVRVGAADVLASGEAAAAALRRAVDEAIVLAGAELLGVMARAFDITLEYLRTRVQFGRPIGSFQALQHRAADLLVQRSLAESLLRDAVRIMDGPGEADSRSVIASRVKARLSEAALCICAEAVQMHGAMGMTDECDIGLFLQRSLVLSVWLGNAAAHRRRFARLAPAESEDAYVAQPDWIARADALGERRDIDWNALPDADFRGLMRTFFERHFPRELRYMPRRARWHEFRDWYRELSRRGLIAPNWPRQFGGMGLSPGKQRIFTEEQERFALVRGGLEIGITMVGPLLIRYGSEAQREEYLAPILAGEHVWCQGYSEPNAGSDLASLATSAVLQGEAFVVNGRKLWTSMAQDATHMVLLVRTDPNAKKQAGISFLLVDLAAPGIARRPFNTIAGEQEFCEVLLDDVRMPRHNLVGRLNDGWTMAKSLLGFERIWIGSPKRCMSAVRRVEALARERHLENDAEFVAKFARLRLDVADLGSCYEEFVARVERGETIGPEVSVLKIWATETFQRLSELAIEIAGDCGGFWRAFDFGSGRLDVLSPYYEGRGATIGGGSSEIQRNVLARAVLGLPV